MIVLIRFTYLAVTNAFAVLRLLPRSDRDKDIEILALRHQLNVLQRHLDGRRVRFTPAERAFLAALVTSLPRGTIRRLQLLVSPTPSYDGTETSSPGGTHNAAGPSARADRAHSPRYADWSCAWRTKTPDGATGASTAN